MRIARWVVAVDGSEHFPMALRLGVEKRQTD